MCWNSEVSLNTFLFSSFVLFLVIYNNNYTQYKIKELNNIWTLLFLASFIFMQLFEFFIWRNLNNKFYNYLFSVLGMLLITSQPFFSLMMLSNIYLRNILVFIYLVFAIPLSIYNIYNNSNIHSEVGKNGHLRWFFMKTTPIIYLGWLFFLLFSLFYEGKWGGFLFGLITLIITTINYMNDDKTIGSMWCWVVNLSMLYFATYLLVFLPFIEKK